MEVGLALGFAGFEDVGWERGKAVLFQMQRVPEDFENQLAARDVFFDSELGWWAGWGKARDGVGREEGAGLEAFGGGDEGGPPARAGFFEEKEFRAVLGADEAGGDDFGVIEDEEFGWGEEGR